GIVLKGENAIIFLLRAAMICLMLLLPMLTLLLYALVGLARRTPLGANVIRGFQRSGLMLTGLLLLAYSGAIIGTAHQEAKANAALERFIHEEGAMEAEEVGKPWPK
ncbi:MAG TPA: hypothetical protein VKT32_05375, partial [Chthonomonadaceae bacterium]|nr:hypothetical protein [Chthonomonadaceae bacterium]